MPGANCALPQCGTTRREKYESIGIFQVSKRTSERYVSWKQAVYDAITKYREADAAFKEQMENGNVWTCEKHYKPADIEFTSKYSTYSHFIFTSSNHSFRSSPLTLALRCEKQRFYHGFDWSEFLSFVEYDSVMLVFVMFC